MLQTLEYPTVFADEITELPHIPQAELNEHGFRIVRGMTRELAAQMATLSQEPAVGFYCPNDYEKTAADTGMKSPGRFYDLAATEKWHGKGREPYMLIKELGSDLLKVNGIIWFGNEKPGKDEPVIPGAEVTFAMRLYDGAAGKRLAFPFTEGALAAHDEKHGSKGVWLEAWGDNPKALKTYTRSGFQEVARIQGRRHGETVDRVYMTLGDLSLAA